MKHFLGRFFAEPPMESQDQAQITNLLTVFIIILEVICGILAFAFLILRADASAPAITILATMFLIGLHVQIHRGYRQLVSWFLPALIYVALVFSIFNYGSLRVSSLLGFAVVLILSALAIGENGLYVFGGLSAIGLISLYWMEVNGIIRPLSSQTELIDLIVVLAVTLAIVALLRSGVRQINSGIKRARERAHELDAQNADLERRVSERTLEIEQINRKLREELEERQKAEEALQESQARYRQLFNGINDAVMVYDLETGRFADCNEGVTHMLGYTRDEFLSLQPADIIHRDFHQTMRANQQRLKSGENTIVESLHQRKDGTTVPVEINSRLVTFQDARMILSVVRDITERRHAEQALIDSEAQLNIIFNTTTDMQILMRVEPGERLIAQAANRAYYESLPMVFPGASPAVIGKERREYMMEFGVSSEAAEIEMPFYREAIGTKAPVHYESEFPTPIGPRHFKIAISPVINQAGECTHVLWSGHDITEEKQAENALRESYDLLSRFIQNSPIYAFIKEVTPKESRVRWASENYEEMIGVPGSKMEGKTMQELFPLEFAEKITADDWAIASSGNMLRLNEDLNGRNYTTIKFPIRSGGKHLLAGYTIDITERQQAEMALQESELKFRSIFNQSVDAIGVSKAGIHVMANAAYLQMFGYDYVEELVGKPVLDLIAPSHHLQIQEYTRLRLTGENVPSAYETRGLRRDGSEFDMEVHVSTYELLGELYVVPILRDITERKRSEVALHESENRYRAIVESTPDLICRFLPDTTLTFVNTAYCQYFGKDSQELVGRRFLEMIPREDQSAVKEQINSIIAKKESYTYEHEVVDPHGEIRWQQWTDSPILSDSGQVIELQSVGRDITEHKVAEKVLQESERRFREMLQGVELAGVMLDEAGHIMFINDFLLRITGWSRDEALGESWFDKFLPEELREGMWSSFGRLMAGEEVIPHYENEILTQGPERRLIRWNNTLLFNSNGIVIGTASIGEDITERRQTEAVLRESEARLTQAQRIGKMGSWEWDIQQNTSSISEPLLEIYGISDASVIQGLEDFSKLIHPEDRAKVLAATEQALRDETFFDMEYRIVRPTGEVIIVHSRAETTYDASHVPLRMTGTLQDITERKEMEDLLIRRAVQLEKVAQISSAVSAVLDIEALLPNVANLVNEQFGYYHTHIYLLNKSGKTLALAAGSGEVGFQMLAKGHHIPLDHPRSIVARVAREKQGAIINDVSRAEDFLPNPFLPETRSELAVPLIVGNQMMGVFDVQSKEKDHFTTGDTYIQTTLAGQVAISIQNARQFAERTKVEERLQTSLREKETFLREIHHRVKNNLQVISSLLYLQAQNTTDTTARDMLLETRNRVESISLVHEKLYQTSDLAQIPFGTYISDLVNFLYQSYAISPSRISFSLEADQTVLDINKAIPCGLILSEIVSNAFKHAFPEERTGKLQIKLQSDPDQQVHLTLSDNGVGFPSDLGERPASSLGLTLIERLAAQLQGKIERTSSTTGTTFRVWFKNTD